LLEAGLIKRHPVVGGVAAVSVGIVDGAPLLDLDYSEDVRAQVDMNVVATHIGDLVEVQGTAEGEPFPRATLDALMDLALEGTQDLSRLQEEALVSHGSPWPGV
jgi:ribonuclease PH